MKQDELVVAMASHCVNIRTKMVNTFLIFTHQRTVADMYFYYVSKAGVVVQHDCSCTSVIMQIYNDSNRWLCIYKRQNLGVDI